MSPEREDVAVATAHQGWRAPVVSGIGAVGALVLAGGGDELLRFGEVVGGG